MICIYSKTLKFCRRFWRIFIWMLKSNWFCIITLHDWLRKLAPVFVQSEVIWFRIRFPALRVSYVCLLRALISSLDFLRPLWLARVITFGFSFTSLNWNLSYSNMLYSSQYIRHRWLYSWTNVGAQSWGRRFVQCYLRNLCRQKDTKKNICLIKGLVHIFFLWI